MKRFEVTVTAIDESGEQIVFRASVEEPPSLLKMARLLTPSTPRRRRSKVTAPESPST